MVSSVYERSLVLDEEHKLTLYCINFSNGSYIAYGTRGLAGSTFEATLQTALPASPTIRQLLGDPDDLRTAILAERLIQEYVTNIFDKNRGPFRLVLALSIPKELLHDSDLISRICQNFTELLRPST